MHTNSIKLSFVYILSLLAIVSCLQEERSPEDILVPSPAQVETSDASLMLASKVPSGSEKLVQECGFYYSKDKSMADTRKVAGVLAANNFTAELPDRTYGTTYYICAYVTNGHGSEIRSDLRTFQLDELEEYVEFGQVNMVSFDPSSKQLMITIDTDIWAGVSVSEAGVCYGIEPTSLSIEGDHKEGVYRSDTRAEAGVIEILLNNFSEATQYYLRPYVKDGDYLSYGEVVPFYIPAVAKVSTFDAEAVTASGATLSGEVTDECGSAVTERGFAWIEGDAVPTIEDSHMAAGSGLGAMTATVEGLDPNKKYTFRAYATNASGTAYGEAKVFTTLVALPSLAASTISNITSTSATFNGVLANNGGESVSEVGFYYSTEKEVNPETAQKVSLEYSTYQKSAKELSANTLYSAIQSAQAAASDEGEAFSIDVFSLGIKTKYYVKSYAVNSAGVAYGSVVNFETAGEIATIKTVGSSEVTTSSSVLSANITTDNGEKITERGFVWMEGTGNPTTDSNKLKVSGEVGEYTATLEGLDPNKKYSFRAYAINAEGTAYGDVMSFTTKVALPALSNVVIPSLSSTTATLTSKVTYHGGETVTEVGFYYSTESDVDPETSQKVSRIYSEDTFSIEVANLGINTKYYVKAYAINSAGTAYSEINSFKTESSVPSVQTIGVADITPESALLSGSVLSDNGASITERGFVWIQGDGTPTVDSHKLTATGTTGEFTSSLTGLEPNKKYSFRAYATNSKGTAYGEIMTFSTVAGLPVLSSVDVSAITSTSATFASTVTDHGGETVSEVGFYYSTDETVDPATSVKVTQKYAKDAFTSQIADLAIFTKYYVKAYATNSAGTAYSVIYSFTTLASTPVVNTIGSSEVTSTTAVLSGTVVADNGAEVTERGFVWMLVEGAPTIDSYKITTSGKIGDYTATVKDLAPNQKYSFRAYAVNSVGTSYGETMSFTTSISKASLASVTISNIEETSATISSKVTGHGGDTVSEVGFYYSTEEAVDPEKSVKVNRVYSSDSFSISISELAINTKYYVKAYAVNSAGTVYSDVASFTTLASTPVVNTVGSSEISSTGAVLSGTVVTDNGAAITERGFVWLKGTDAPTTSSNKVKVEGATGDFTATISGLDPNQKYSFRAYAINSKGTAYGDIMTFNTVAGLPALSAMKVSSITTTSATFTCTVTNHGGETVSEVGFYYSKEESVDVETAQKISEVYSSDAFTLKADDLEIGQNYYVKAYVKNSVGEAYSAVIAFKTTSTAPSVSTIGYTKLSATSAELSGQVLDDNGENITERGFVWVKGTSTPTTSSSKQSVEGTVGDYTATITDLEPNQIYSFRAYAINSKGTAYGDVIQLQIDVTLPTVTTNEVTGITNTTATSGGVITSDGGGEILAKGVVWSMRPNPTIESSNYTDEGEGSGAFTSRLTDLRQGLTYYVRAYATNIMGTVYGEEKQFTTTGEIYGTPLEASNSFIISYPGTYTFQTVKGNSYESVGSVASAEVLWESFGTDEQPEVGSLVPFAVYKSGKIIFETPDQFCEGNAVIAAKDASGTILWSWHIWLTDQPQEHIYSNNAATMMDRNLGATSAAPGDIGALGLFYQWGRKDPFLGSSSISSPPIIAKSTITWPSVATSYPSNGTIAYATEHPTTFITGNQDWYYDVSSLTGNTRWQSEKTIYDPCPAGWRVPDGGEDGVWSTAKGSSSFYTRSYDDINKGMNFSGDLGNDAVIWYPASSSLDNYEGSLSSVGLLGHYWSCSPHPSDSYYAYYLYFDSNGNVRPVNNTRRANAMSVRCQKEGTGGGPKYDNDFSTFGARSLSDSGTANSYIVSTAGTYSISAVKGNSSESVGSVASAEVLWESFGTDEAINKGSLLSGARYENGRVYFKTAESYREGNAVIAAKDASGAILWSWHIWLTDQPQELVYKNDAGIFMDRNIGATSSTPSDVGSLGLFYQWGRKDPFLGSSSIKEDKLAESTIQWPKAVASSESSGTIEYSISNPTTFISKDEIYNNGDWYYTGSTSTDDTRWQAKKTIYDPCPVGWQVPEKKVWSLAGFDGLLFDGLNIGISFPVDDSNTTWYPAAGYRDYNGGSLYVVVKHGYYWSVTTSGKTAYRLDFANSGYSRFLTSSRGQGYSVRCQKE